jgi:hypothetical protein
MMKNLLVLAILIGTTLTSLAQNKTQFTLTLKDGNVITGTTKITQIILTTDYGRLEIPVQNVTSIELGIHADESQKKNILNLAKQLSNSNEDMRSNAYKALIELNANAIPVAEGVLYSTTYTPGDYSDYTLANAINELKAIHSVSNDYKTKDVVSIDYEYNMGGKYDFKSVELKTEYGMLTIPRNKIERIDVMYFDASSNNGMKVFKLFASTHVSGNNNGGWLKTGIMVKNGQSMNIISTGEVTFASLSGNKYKPDGSYKNSSSNDFTANTATGTYPVYGNTVFKIGESGAAQQAAANFNGKANASGMLYLSIYETVYNASNTGFYVVKIKVK